jgi:hypothetical protein
MVIYIFWNTSRKVILLYSKYLILKWKIDLKVFELIGGEVHFRNINLRNFKNIDGNLYKTVELFTIVLWCILHSWMEEYNSLFSLGYLE